LAVAAIPLYGCEREKVKHEASTVPASTVSASAGAAAVVASAAAAPTAPKPAKPGPLNVLLLTVDSLRADMPWTGYPREIAPNLSKVAQQAVVYENAYSISSYTAKSVATLLSGQYPSSLYRSGWFFAGYGDANQFLPEFMQKANVRTLSAHAHLYFDRGKNLNQGFDVWELVKGLQFDAQTDNSVTSD
jgi:arylsulfatase A-like enzyme